MSIRYPDNSEIKIAARNGERLYKVIHFYKELKNDEIETEAQLMALTEANRLDMRLSKWRWEKLHREEFIADEDAVVSVVVYIWFEED